VFFLLLNTRSAGLIILATVVALILHAAMYGPQAAFISELFSTRLRYSGASLGYQIAGVLGGALAPIISIALLSRFDTWVAVAVYVSAMLVITIVAVFAAQETSRVDLHAEKPEERVIIDAAA
jgi:MFS family permease